MAEQRELDVTIISAQDLKNVTTFGKQSPFAVVWIHPSRKMTTPVATHGGVNPSWNAVVKVLCEQRLIDQGNGVMTIEILNKGSISNTQIGSVTVPLSHAIARDADKTSPNQPKYMSFQVQTCSKTVVHP
jgi:Ca2+-dependent lipid-binding protein